MPDIEPDFPYRTAVNAYGLYCIPEVFRKREVAKLLLRGKVNEGRTLTLMQQFVGNGDIISGGAFVGDFLPFLSRSLKRGAHLHCFEPNPVGFAPTQMTLALNEVKNARLSPVAVGRARAVLPLLVADAEGRPMGGTSKIVESAQEGMTLDVELVPLDELVPEDRKVSVLQLDVEGHEAPALEGAARIIEKGRPLVVVETLAAQNPAEIKALLGEIAPKANYKLMGMMERNAFYKPLGG